MSSDHDSVVGLGGFGSMLSLMPEDVPLTRLSCQHSFAFEREMDAWTQSDRADSRQCQRWFHAYREASSQHLFSVGMPDSLA